MCINIKYKVIKLGNFGRRPNDRGRYRRMYELTGVPSWIRYGTSPRMRGGGRGMGPCAQYLQNTGQFDEFLKDFAEKNPNLGVWQNAFKDVAFDTKYEKALLTDRIDMLQEEIKELKMKLKDLR